MGDGADSRERILSALHADLVGPFYPRDADGPRDEVLPLPPSRWYLTGFLAPQAQQDTHDPTADEELGAGPDEDDEETAGQEPEPKQKHRFQASMGMSVLLPPAGRTSEAVRVTVAFAEYVPEPREEEGRKRPRTVWRRVAREPRSVELPLDPSSIAAGAMLPDAPGIWVVGRIETAEAPGLEPGTRALSVFVVNRRSAPEKPPFDAQFLFQVRMELEHVPGLVARPNRQGEQARDWDDRVADLQFRDRFEHAVGHGVSVEVPPGQKPVTRVRTTWIPGHEVRQVITREEPSVVTEMERLAELPDGAAVREALSPLVDAYRTWLDGQARIAVDSTDREQTRDQLIRHARAAAERIEAGIERVACDAEMFEAFRLANRAMALSALRRSPGRYSDTDRPAWRLFQLAFILMNVEGVADETHRDRDNVELIFFPTGGGKTEAYLGVIAFTLLMRRLRGQSRDDRGLGVAVLLRYTLRLLTLDQLGRAATLICALETLRQAAPERLGRERFTVGLWVGRTATANTLEQLRLLIIEYKNSASKTAPSPFPLATCPWCSEPLGRDSLTLVPSPAKAEAVVVGCLSIQCEFSARRNRDGLPVLFVDEQIYRELPSFLVATVDKFAMMPWRGETGMLFGRASFRDGGRFFGPMDPKPRGASALAEGLRPPELIVQDELHLISGPLGTMVGLYETAIEHLSTRRAPDGQRVRPKVIASTATVRRAREQIRALFGRADMALFPPPGVDAAETWFATLDAERPGRLYVGVAAQGRSMKGILLRTYANLLAAAQKQYDPRGPADQPADAYMTVAGYFNSLRELGGMRRLVEDDVRGRCTKIEDNVPVDHAGPHPTLRNRKIQAEPVELTSRESTGRIKQAKDRLNKLHADADHVDVLLASNMISVGVDIDRLGLMVVAGQPKTTAEYIQASSRVGRQHPGLVVTCFNMAKPRDRSHYERFAAYHQSFYRFVEATSLTPFSGPALERGLAGTLVAMTRLSDPEMTPPGAAMAIEAHRELGELAVRVLAERAGAHTRLTGADHDRLVESLRDRGQALLDAWETVVRRARDEGAARRSYSRFDRDKSAGKPLLFMAIDEEQPVPGTDESRFAAPTSMRDVEESVHLWIERGALGGRR